MRVSGITDRGKYRSENQDTYRFSELGDAILAVVCDGMGGAAGGRTAAAARRITAEASIADITGLFLMKSIIFFTWIPVCFLHRFRVFSSAWARDERAE